MKKLIAALGVFALTVLMLPTQSLAAGGIYASGGKTTTVGSTITISVVASGATFDTVHGSISISGPVSVTSFVAGDATWISKPSDGGTFDGAFLGDKKTSFTVATIKLKGTGVGSGSVNVSGASLKNAGTVVGSGSGGTNFTFQKAADLPGTVNVTSSSHPDQNTPYEATTIALSWDKASGVDGFSYLLDQATDTTPASSIKDANTSASYPNQAVGVYYFHIKAHKADGWGPVTHFKVTIKEPDPKINDQLTKPSKIKIDKTSNYSENLKDGTVTGIVISGITEANYSANITLTPAPTLPEGKTLTAKADGNGNFNLVIDYPIKSGVYLLTIQGQQDKVLTPVSDQIMFEISLAKGGAINILTEADLKAPVVAAIVKGSFFKNEYPLISYLIVSLVLAIVILGSIELVKFIRRKRAERNIH